MTNPTLRERLLAEAGMIESEWHSIMGTPLEGKARAERDLLREAAQALATPQPAPVVDDLREVEAYFEERADAEYHTDSPSPTGNEEMRLLAVVQAAISALASQPASDRLAQLEAQVEKARVIAGLLARACELLSRCDFELKWQAMHSTEGDKAADLLGDIAAFGIDNEKAADELAAIYKEADDGR